jgi:hypothetical protein
MTQLRLGQRLSALIRYVVVTCILVLALAVLLVLGLIVAPEIDERVGFFTTRATTAIQSYEVSGQTVRRMVDSHFRNVRWRAYHQDIPMQTFVECVGTPRSGGPERHMLWYVDERPTWNGRPSLRITVMTVLNGDALQVTPNLFDPRAGFGLDRWRRGVELPR